MRNRVRDAAIGVGVFVTLVLNGCALDVDLTATPFNVPLGGDVNLKVKVTNTFNCPIRGVVAIVIPFVPRGTLIDQIDDPGLRSEVQGFIDDFCAPGEFELDFSPDEQREASCQLDGGTLVCRIQPGGEISLPEGLEETVDVGLGEGEGVSCETDGTSITCRIPKPILDNAQETIEQQGEQQVPIICDEEGPIGICIGLALNPGEMQMDDLTFSASALGTFHHYVIAFATDAGGVCRTGVPFLVRGQGCNEDADCVPSMTPDCAPGVCSGSSNPLLNGVGCDPAVAAQCTNGTCTECDDFFDPENLLSAIACETTVVGATAPAASQAGLVGLAMALFVMAALILRRHRHVA